MDNSAHTRDHRNEDRSFEEPDPGSGGTGTSPKGPGTVTLEDRSFEEQEPPKGPGTVTLEDNSFEEQEPPKGPGTVELNG